MIVDGLFFGCLRAFGPYAPLLFFLLVSCFSGRPNFCLRCVALRCASRVSFTHLLATKFEIPLPHPRGEAAGAKVTYAYTHSKHSMQA